MKTVLVVDDDYALCRTLEIHLELHGLKVFSALNGTEGEKMAHKLRPDVILLDLNLPDKIGYNLLETLKKELPHSKIIMISSYSSIKNAVNAIRLGAIDFLEKPFDVTQVIQLIAPEGEVE